MTSVRLATLVTVWPVCSAADVAAQADVVATEWLAFSASPVRNSRLSKRLLTTTHRWRKSRTRWTHTKSPKKRNSPRWQKIRKPCARFYKKASRKRRRHCWVWCLDSIVNTTESDAFRFYERNSHTGDILEAVAGTHGCVPATVFN